MSIGSLNKALEETTRTLEKTEAKMGGVLKRLQDIANQSPVLGAQIDVLLKRFQDKTLTPDALRDLWTQIQAVVESMRQLEGVAPSITGSLGRLRDELGGSLGEELEKLMRR